MFTTTVDFPRHMIQLLLCKMANDVGRYTRYELFDHKPFWIGPGPIYGIK